MQINRPTFFLFILVLIAFFLIGMRFGKKIERVDKKYACLKTPAPTPLPLKFNTFSSPCGLKFLYPVLTKKPDEKSASSEQKLTYDKQTISVNCNKEQIDKLLKNKNLSEIKTIKNQKMSIYETADGFLILTNYYKNRKSILISLPKNLLNLFEETVSFF